MPHKTGDSTTRLRHKAGSSPTTGGASSATAAAPEHSHDLDLVSVIIPAFNAQDSIAATLESVLCQTWSRFEAIVVDDGSTDRTAEIVEQIARKDNRVRIYHQKNGGVADARNRGIRESAGNWIAPLDADDIWTPEYLESEIRKAQQASDRVAVIYSWSTRIDLEGLTLPGVSASAVRGKVLSTLLCHNFLGNGSCTLIRRSALESVGGYHQRFSPTEDWDLYLRLAEHYEFVPVQRFLVKYRQGPQSASSNQEAMADGQARMLSGMRRRNSSVPTWLCKISQSNLYVYHASRSRECGDVAAMRRWLRRANQAHWFALVRPGWWSLWTFGGLSKGGKPAASRRTLRRSLEVLSKLVGSTVLHSSLRWVGRGDVPRKVARP